MHTLLIAESSDTYAGELEATLQDQWSLQICMDGYAAEDALKHFTPDALLIDLRLNGKDGLSVLEECFPVLPPVILALTDLQSKYIVQTAESLGVGYMMQVPCSADRIKERLADMFAASQTPPSILARHLKALQVDPDHSGHRCTIASVILYKEDPEQMMNKEVYDRVAQECNLTNDRCVERVIRYALFAAWKKRNLRIWEHYFPLDENGDIEFPGSAAIIKRLSELI